MPSYKLNLGIVRACPNILPTTVALESYGRPTDKSYGVLSVTQKGDNVVEFEFYATRENTVKQADRQTGSVTKKFVPKDEIFKARLDRLSDGTGVLACYSGGPKSIETVDAFLSSLEIENEKTFGAEPVQIDIESSLSELVKDEAMIAIQSCKLTGYEDGEEPKATGSFTVQLKSMEPEAAHSFVIDHIAQVQQVKAKAKLPKVKKAMVLTLRPFSYFTFNHAEVERANGLTLCRKLAGCPEAKGE